MSFIGSTGRLLLSGIFISGGSSAFLQPGGRPKAVEKAGIPAPHQAVLLNGAAMTIGGAAIATGIFPKLASIGLIASLIPTTLVGHAFWNEKDPQAMAMQRIQFLKNLGLIGGLLLILQEKD